MKFIASRKQVVIGNYPSNNDSIICSAHGAWSRSRESSNLFFLLVQMPFGVLVFEMWVGLESLGGSFTWWMANARNAKEDRDQYESMI